MSDSINWLFLTDLHYGLDDHAWLWPKFRHDFYKDLERMVDQVGPWDIVFFTGDFVQAGKADEFCKLNQELDFLWKKLSKYGNVPLLCPVPGNHDLMRPQRNASLTRIFTESWWNNEEARKEFWRDKNCEGRKAVAEHFANYEMWLSQLPVPSVEREVGILPGDFSAIFRKRDVELGIVGLNSAFLQVSNVDVKGKLDLHVSQLNEVCGGDPSTWVKERTASLLLTHHPPSWLAPKAFEHYRQEIYPAGRFLGHLCGHQHESETLEICEAGGLPRRYRHGASVFGLEEWQGVTPQKRAHGYIAGQYNFEGTNSIEKYWPRTIVKTRDGVLKLCPDQSFNIQDDNYCVVPFDTETDDDVSHDCYNTHTSTECFQAGDQIVVSEGELNILGKAPDLLTARSRLDVCPKLSLGSAPHHKAVRQEEQSQFELELRKTRSVWLVADWGTGKEGFLAVTLERFRVQGNDLDVFHLLCDDAEDENSFLALFPRQFGMPLQAFCGYVAALPCAFLVLDGVHEILGRGEGLLKIKRIVAAVLDFCPELRVVLTSRKSPEAGMFSQVNLYPLEVPDVRTYLLHHPSATPGLRDPLVIDKIHERTDGLPMLLDRLLLSLKVSSLESVLDAEMEVPSEKESLSEAVPKALVHALNTLEKSADKRSKRSLRLLKVLSVLPYGETLETLKHFMPTEPFFIEHALQLHEMALLDAISLKNASPCLSFEKNGVNEENASKILKVPRQIGQYVLSELTDDERNEIVLSGAERFFGSRWRYGKIKLRSMPYEYREYASTGVGNEFAIVHHLISEAKKMGDAVTGRKAGKLGILYCHRLRSQERYRDLFVVAGGLLQTISRDEVPEQWSELAALNGAALRMTNRSEDALTYLNDSLEVGQKHLDNEQKASIWLDIALAEETLGHADLAIKASLNVQGLVKPKSNTHLHAVVIEAGLTLKGRDRIQRLKELEKQAQESGVHVIASNICLNLASEADAPNKKLEILDRIVVGKEDVYNRTRVVVERASAIEQINSVPLDLTRADLSALSAAYSYLYSQRFGVLFDKCHSVLWNLLEAQKDTTQLYRLFRHSSFLWRLRGDEAKEAEYLNRLSGENLAQKDSAGSPGSVLEVRYFLTRFKVIVAAFVKT